MTDRDRAIAALKLAGYTCEERYEGSHEIHRNGSERYVLLDYPSQTAEIGVPWSEVPTLLSPLTLEMVERAVAQAREMLIDQHNDWTPRRREAGHAALDLFRLCLRQQMGGGQG